MSSVTCAGCAPTRPHPCVVVGLHAPSRGGSSFAGPTQRRAPAQRPAPRWVQAQALRPGETPEAALERRLRESQRVEERVTYVADSARFDAELARAGGRLVVLDVHSERVCQTGWEEEAELHWKEDRLRSLEPCVQLKHTFARTARDCPDVEFLAVDADEEESAELLDRLGIEVLPTLQFWRHGRMLWEHRGVSRADQDLGEGVLYFGDTAANNEKASSHVRDLRSRADFDAFLAAAADDKVLRVVDVSLTDAAPCVHIFPAVLALARNFVGFAAFARLLGDENDEVRALMAELNIVEVPTFLFYRGGKEVGRHVGSSRGDLIGQILAQQASAGVAPPPPAGGTPRRRAAAAAPAPTRVSPASRWR